MKKCYLKNNKGVAMISVMIAITFISIVASAMLIISTSNYAMKASNVFSKQNSYSTDAELTRTVSTIRNTVLGGSNPDTTNISLLTDTSNASKYDCKKIMALVYPGETVKGTSKDAYIEVINKNSSGDEMSKEVIHFKSEDNNCSLLEGAAPDPSNPGSFITGVTRYTFKKFVVTNTTTYNTSDFSAKEKSYYNSSKTDIIFDIYSSSTPASVGGGVGNMSLMMNAPLVTTGNSDFSVLTMTGNTFITDYAKNSSGKHIVDSFTLNIDGTVTNVKMSRPGSEALVVNNCSKINMAGDYNVVYGDIVLEDNTSLFVHGNLTVYGDIIIKDNATLVLDSEGAVYFMKNAFPHSDGVVRKSQVKYGAGCSKTNNVYPSNALDDDKIFVVEDKSLKGFIDLLKLSDDDTDNDGLIYAVLRKDNFFGTADKYVIEYTGDVGSLDSTTDAKTGLSPFCEESIKGYRTTSTFNGRKIGFGFLDKNTDVINGGAHDMLLFVCEGRPDMKTYNIYPDWNNWQAVTITEPYTIEYREFAPNMTIISSTRISLGVQHGVVYSKLGSEEFNYITGIKGPSTETSGEYNSSYFNNIRVKFSTTYNGRVGTFFDKNCNSTVDQAFGYATNGGGDGSKQYASTIYFDNYEKDNIKE